MRKISLLLLTVLMLSACSIMLMDKPQAELEEQWWKNGYSVEMKRDILLNRCGFRDADGIEDFDKRYKPIRIKADLCMLNLGFQYMPKNVQHERLMPRSFCKFKEFDTYELPSCKAYREYMENRSFWEAIGDW